MSKKLMFKLLTVLFIFIFLIPPIIDKKRVSKMAICAGNLKQIGFAIQMYIQDYENLLPLAYDKISNKYWVEFLKSYLSDSKTFVCPADKIHVFRGTNYIYNEYFINPKKLTDFKNPENIILLIDGKPDIAPFFNYNNYKICIDFRHSHVLNNKREAYILFLDGSVKAKSSEDIFTINQFYGY